MHELSRQSRSSKVVAQARDTGLALVLLALLSAWLINSWPLVAVATGLLILCMLCPVVFRCLVAPWFALSAILGAISSRVVLGLLFFAVVTPVGVIRRLLGYDPLRRRSWKAGVDSVFRVREHRYVPRDLETPY